MKIRTLLLAGSVLPIALAAPSLALERTSQPILLAQAQAEECAADDAACLERAQRREERAKRREQQRQEAEEAEQEAESAPAEAQEETPAADAPAADTRAEEPAETEPAQSETQAAPAEAEQPSARELRRQQRELRRQQQAEEAQEEAAEPPAVVVVPEPAAEPDSNTLSAPVVVTPPAETQAAPAEAAPAEADQPSARELRRQARERRRLEQAEEAQQQQQQVEPPAAATSAPAPATTTEAPPVIVLEPGEAEPMSREERRRAREERRRQRELQAAEPTPVAPTAPATQQPATAPAPAAGESTVEQQLESQGSEEQAEQIRRLRRKLQEAQDGRERDGDRREIRRGERVERRGDRDIITFGGQVIIRPSENAENERLLYGASDVEVVELPNGFTETTVYRENGSEIVTVRNEYGEIVTRVRRTRNGREVVLIDNRQPEGPPPIIIFEEELPPLVVEIPREEYIVETRRADVGDITAAFEAPPVERVERAYTLEEVRRSERLRDKVRRVDLDTITFDTGSAVVKFDQLDALDQVGTAIEEVLAENPEEVFLIEGHTDAVGSDESNLILSDRRAEAVAVALSQDFAIPPENLVTQGYGEEFLKVPTQGPERENRRVTMRNIAPLLSAAKQ